MSNRKNRTGMRSLKETMVMIPRQLIRDATVATRAVRERWMAGKMWSWSCWDMSQATAAVMRQMGYDAWTGASGHAFTIIGDNGIDRWIVDNWGPGPNMTGVVVSKPIVTVIDDPEYDLDDIPVRWEISDPRYDPLINPVRRNPLGRDAAFGNFILKDIMTVVRQYISPATIKASWGYRNRSGGYAEFHIPPSPEFPKGFYYADQDKAISHIKSEGWERALRSLGIEV